MLAMMRAVPGFASEGRRSAGQDAPFGRFCARAGLVVVDTWAGCRTALTPGGSAAGRSPVRGGTGEWSAAVSRS
jgi:hypothetical protein